MNPAMYKKYFLLYVTFFGSLVSSYGFTIGPRQISGYTYLPSGPITHTELSEFSAQLIKDEKGNGRAGLNSLNLDIRIKKSGEKSYRYYKSVPVNSENVSVRSVMDTLCLNLALNDSVAIWVDYTVDDNDALKEQGFFYVQTVMKYGVKSETMAHLIRKGESLITLYPNPCINKSIVVLDVNEKMAANYYLLDGMGSQILDGDIYDIREEILLDLTGKPSGTYIFYLWIEKELFTKIVVKE